MSDCIFCKIANGEMETELLYKDEQVVAFKDINPQAAIHFLIIPVKHIPTIYDLEEEDNQLVGHMYQVAKKLAEEYNIAERGYRMVANCKDDGGQVVYHVHFHLLGGEKLGDLC
ncbi:MAG TPA: histidine triad nucleotide-binding protein [Halanaerobiaceae bacterium]|jgi:histidine triad (HIT) family protein|nr:histidine triad nucleotide-binding protein [Bacillota bacterium]HHU92000.1 histidine triad nucleotide-binding protein [Halanaerobiaceae bacterium]HOA40822.1 histidine triad nucleotide-binding protein [Halanaerobiales bacterium]HPZ62931.1 histidine triad nucleotide-binding protein [Halanaerobiales bacterium]HQD04164.1 histidine triad nucleotide-binding protein [Halanaerobiales bacterium]